MRDVDYIISVRDKETGQLIYEASVEDLDSIPEFIDRAEPEIAQYVEELTYRHDPFKWAHDTEREIQAWQETV